jgi:hypothetical protein
VLPFRVRECREPDPTMQVTEKGRATADYPHAPSVPNEQTERQKPTGGGTGVHRQEHEDEATVTNREDTVERVKNTLP